MATSRLAAADDIALDNPQSLIDLPERAFDVAESFVHGVESGLYPVHSAGQLVEATAGRARRREERRYDGAHAQRHPGVVPVIARAIPGDAAACGDDALELRRPQPGDALATGRVAAAAPVGQLEPAPDLTATRAASAREVLPPPRGGSPHDDEKISGQGKTRGKTDGDG